jgi:phosphohistidine phosphatase SixA
MRFGGLLPILLACTIASAFAGGAGGANDHYTLYLVRHAEKLADDGDDPGLTTEGLHRSQQLANWLHDRGVTDIWSSDYRRSRDTAGPLASALGRELMLYDPHDLPALATELRKNGRNALVVGHSNTTPELARLLCECLVSDMDDSDYDQLMLIAVSESERRLEVLSQQLLFPAADDS